MQNEPEVTKASVYRPPSQRNGNSGDVSKIDFFVMVDFRSKLEIRIGRIFFRIFYIDFL